jgi:hypothetical protein
VGTLRNDGLITVSADQGTAQGARIAYGGTFENLGDIRVSGLEAVGMSLTYLDQQHNGGRISVHAQNDATAVQAQSNDVTLSNDGKIAAVSQNGDAVAVQFLYVAELDNTGSITASGFEAGGYQSVGVMLSPSYWQESRIDNSGVIRAGVAIEATSGYGDPQPSIIDNSGKILGDIALISANDQVINTGLIRGNIDLGDGRDVYDGSHGRLVGSIDGGAGDDELIGGKKGEVLIGGAGADDLSGGGGADTFAFHHTSDSAVAHPDLILDLQDGDSIDLSAIDADIHTSGDQAFIFVGAFDGHAGEATLAYDSANDLTLLQADTNGDGVADMVVDIAGDHSSFSSIVL